VQTEQDAAAIPIKKTLTETVTGTAATRLSEESRSELDHEMDFVATAQQKGK
jgi:hypothetical protein